MKQLSPRKIKNVLAEVYDHVEPSNDIWKSVADTLPTPHKRYILRKKTYRTVLVTAVLVVTVFTMVAAGTDPGREMLDRIFDNFGIHLREGTPELEEQLKQQETKAVFIGGLPLEENMDKIPKNMRLPAYLPKEYAYSHNSIYVLTVGLEAQIRWSERWSNDSPYVSVEFHEEAFGKGSVTITNGASTDMQEVQIGSTKGFAFKDNNGWNVSWTLDGHQYGIMTNISLEEAIRVAESIK